MPGRRDWPENAANFVPWTLDITSNTAVATPQSTDAAEGEYPTNAFDVRRCRGYSLQVVVAANTVQTSAAVVELQWSNDQVNYISLGSGYQLTLAASASKVSYGFIVTNPFYQFVKLACITAGGAGSTAAGTTVFFAARD